MGYVFFIEGILPCGLAWIRAACLLGDLSEEINLLRTTLVGWGLVEANQEQSNVLLEVELISYNHSVCAEESLYRQPEIFDTEICAGEWYYGNKGSCFGDSGGKNSFIMPCDQIPSIA